MECDQDRGRVPTTAPTGDWRSRAYFNPLCHRSIRRDAAQVWELSSPSEAAKAAALLAFSAPETPLSQPAKARQLPQGIGGVGLISIPCVIAISGATKLKCGSCRAPARLRRRRYCWHFLSLAHRFRSLAKARQLPQGICGVALISIPCGIAVVGATQPKCGSCRALARLRRRRYCWHFLRLRHRFRSLAKARQLPQGVGGVGLISIHCVIAVAGAMKLKCGSCRALARLRRRRYCWHFLRLRHRFCSLAKARQLPQGIGGVALISIACGIAVVGATQLKCGSCRAPARLRRRRYCWYLLRLAHRFRSLAKARQLPQGVGGVGLISISCGIAVAGATKPKCGSCRALARLRRRRHGR